jgi:glycosyltransferase involved in cell wall biosynthesis
VRRVLIFTRLHPVKGVDLIFPAVERLSAIAELTALEYGPLASDYVARYGRWVRFVKPIPHEKIFEFLAGFDLVIGQMKLGVLGLMEIETLAAGRPVIAAVDASLYGDDPPPVIAASSPDEIIAAIERIRDDAPELERICAAGRSWVARNHSFAHHLQTLEATYFAHAENRRVRD